MSIAHSSGMGSFNLPILGFILILSGCCGDFAQAQLVAAAPRAAKFKPMIVTGTTPQVVGLNVPPNAPPLRVPPAPVVFPKLIPYPNIGSHNTPGQAQTIINNTQALPPASMMPNKAPTNPNPFSSLPGGLGGGGGTPPNYSRPPTPGNIPNYTPSRRASDDGDVNASDRDPLKGRGNKCNPPVQSDYAQEFAKVPITGSIRTVAGAQCDEPQTDRLICMACNLYFEVSPKDSYEGHVAVARSVMTRAASSPYPKDVCHVVYQHNEHTAQYSWIFESPKWNPDHVLPDANDPRLQLVFRASVEGLQKGPNGFTNYYAHDLVTPPWSRRGNCAATLCTIEHHTFCAINAKQNRTPGMYLTAEGITPPSPRNLASDADSTK